MNTYVIVVKSATGVLSVSQEAYPSLEAAQDFCLKRGDRPRALSEWIFKSDSFTYQIFAVYVKSEAKKAALLFPRWA